jgi:RNA polymerase primary sigma factor
LRQRFGINLADELTLEEVGVQFGLTRERIRQIESRGLKQLKKRRGIVKLLYTYLK